LNNHEFLHALFKDSIKIERVQLGPA